MELKIELSPDTERLISDLLSLLEEDRRARAARLQRFGRELRRIGREAASVELDRRIAGRFP